MKTRIIFAILALCLPAAAQVPACPVTAGAGQITITDTLLNPISALPFVGTIVIHSTTPFWIGSTPYTPQDCSIRVTTGALSVSVTPGTYSVTVNPDSGSSYHVFWNITATTPNPARLADVTNGPMLPSPGMFVSLSSISFSGAGKGTLIAGSGTGWGLFTPTGTCNPLIIDTTQPLGYRSGAFVAPLTCTGGAVGITQTWIGALKANGAPLTFRPTLNLQGSGVSCSDNSGTATTDCTFTGGGGGGGSGAAPYIASASGLTTLSITAATHGFGTAAVATCFDNATPANLVLCSYARAANGDLTFAFNPAFTGTVQVSNGNGTAGGTPVGTVVNVGVASMPSWLSGSVANAASSPLLTIAAATGQAAHKVLGTGAGTTFGPISLSLADLPLIPLTSGVSGVLPTSGGGTGTATPGLIAGTNVTITGSFPNQTINSSGGGGGGASSTVQLTDFAITRTSNTVLTVAPPSSTVACGDKYWALTTTATITLTGGSAASGAQGWVTVDCTTGGVKFSTNASFTQGSITLSNVSFGSSAATGFPSGDIPLYQVFAGTTAANQWDTVASTDYRSLFRAQEVAVGGSGNLTKTVTNGVTVIDCPACGSGGGGGGSSSTLNYGIATASYGLGSGVNHTVYSWSMPGNTMGSGDCIGVNMAAHFTQTGATSSPIYLQVGTNNIQLGNIGTTDNGHEFAMRVDVCNNPGVTNAQHVLLHYSNNGNGGFAINSSLTTTSLDTTAAQTLAFLWNDGFGAGGQVVNLDEFRVTH